MPAELLTTHALQQNTPAARQAPPVKTHNHTRCCCCHATDRQTQQHPHTTCFGSCCMPPCQPVCATWLNQHHQHPHSTPPHTHTQRVRDIFLSRHACLDTDVSCDASCFHCLIPCLSTYTPAACCVGNRQGMPQCAPPPPQPQRQQTPPPHRSP